MEINPRLAMIKEVDILALALWKALPEEHNENLHAVEYFLESGILYPEVGKILALEDAEKAHDQVINEKAYGNIILSID